MLRYVVLNQQEKKKMERGITRTDSIQKLVYRQEQNLYSTFIVQDIRRTAPKHTKRQKKKKGCKCLLVKGICGPSQPNKNRKKERKTKVHVDPLLQSFTYRKDKSVVPTRSTHFPGQPQTSRNPGSSRWTKQHPREL